MTANKGREREPRDDRPPICPACGVTMGITIDEQGNARFVCLECGFLESASNVRASVR
jgi:ribosomal protein S27AE